MGGGQLFRIALTKIIPGSALNPTSSTFRNVSFFSKQPP